MAFQQAQAEGLCLRYPENFAPHPTMTYETAVNMLLRAITLSQQVPYTWGFIDKPADGQVYLLFVPQGSPFPNDGIRFQEQETRFAIPVGSSRELEVMEVKYGFVPGQDANAWRVRRRYRLHKGGHPQIILVHYSRGQATQIIPSLMNQPVRTYPLRPVNEPAVYVTGDKVGQKVFQHGPSAPPPAIPPNAHPPGVNFNPQAMVAQQNSTMEALERRRDRERGRDRSGSMAGRPPRVEDDDSADETDQISTRTLASTRYKRNHDLMNDVFRQAAFGKRNPPPPPSPYSIFKKSELEQKAAKLAEEIKVLEARSAERKAARSLAGQELIQSEGTLNATDIPMDSIGAESLVV